MQGEAPTAAETFSKLMKNTSYSEQRFDSRAEPLFRIFYLLTICFGALERLCKQGDVDDLRWASHLQVRCCGVGGYDRLVSAAVVGDAMLVVQKTINLAQISADDAALEAAQSDQLRHTLKGLCIA